ncbi:MAG: HK97 family phage prohead protease [Peptoniphilus sp.]|uniref:HK97 family phage prohead protease n=1 Tax=Peptoniphilus sp. TaxID=1971214 RepID=UPI002A75E47F|nr:HK97 family phage prohead protease [Peptoniphilus sp.]MDY2986127.1 HK97 family phage prohead protease [Peptoniphilus sp.]
MIKHIRTMQSDLQLREEQEEMIISGYFAIFNQKTELYKDVFEEIAPEAFNNSLDADVRALINHETKAVLGRTKAGTLELKTDDKGLFGTIRINPKDTEAVNLYERVKRGDVNQCSFGFFITDEEVEHKEGKSYWRINGVELYEVSVCTFPAYENTGVEAREKQEQETSLRRWKTLTKEKLNNAKNNNVE